ncbi:hypothetical protein B0T09DRAFT_19650 [Sordaria sp. MPI-SDFR-AT-0083]|nr:hypothetical protein B0T09DRAFT_19650 [Sordaria sp. MPI-SDFR-AT-0083]
MATGDSTMYDPAIALKAARVAEIHLLAMQSNPLLHAQFPTPESQAALQNLLAKEAYPKIMSAPAEDGVRIITREKGGRGDIVGFLMWDHPSPLDCFGDPPPKDNKKKLEEEGEVLSIPGCRRKYLEEYARLAKEAKEKSGYNQKRCWHLTFLCIDPEHQGQGLATDMMEQFLDMVEYLHDEFGQLPVYLESTMEAVSMYERLGFETEDWFEMKIPAMRKGGCSKGSEGEGEGQSEGEEEMMTYREVCMVYYPGARFRRIS